MTAIRLDGVALAGTIKSELAARVRELSRKGPTPGLGTILVGDDPGSRWYVNGKHKDCGEVGITSHRIDLPESATEDEVLDAIDSFNSDDAVTGYIVQLPLPSRINTDRVLERMDPHKDADGLHPMNLGRLVNRVAGVIDFPLPCTPQGIVELVERNGLSWSGKHVVVVGRGLTVGRPIGSLLTRRGMDATVTLTHTKTTNLSHLVSQADIVVAAAGSAGIITAEMVKPGAVVLDVGVSRDPVSHAVVGDVDPAVWEVAGYVSPNPGGVGPMTRALLLSNVVDIHERKVSGRG